GHPQVSRAGENSDRRTTDGGGLCRLSTVPLVLRNVLRFLLTSIARRRLSALSRGTSRSVNSPICVFSAVVRRRSMRLSKAIKKEPIALATNRAGPIDDGSKSN